MTVPLHTTQFFSGLKAGAGNVLLYTVPTGYRAVVKDVLLINQVASSKFVNVLVDNSVEIVAATLAAAGGSGATLHATLWTVLNQGQTIYWGSVAGSNTAIEIGGYLYPLSL